METAPANRALVLFTGNGINGFQIDLTGIHAFDPADFLL